MQTFVSRRPTVIAVHQLWFATFILRAANHETFGTGDVSPLNSRGLQLWADSGDSRPPLRNVSQTTA